MTEQDAMISERVVIRWREIFILAGILALGLGLRAYQVTERSLWFDEAFCWAMIQFPIAELFERMAQDNNPPLFFLVLKGWTSLFGESMVSMRGLSVVSGCGAILGMYLFMRQAYQKIRENEEDASVDSRATATALSAAALVAVSVFQITWSRELRGYALGTALATYSSWFLFRALDRPQWTRRWVALGIVNLAFIYTHYYALFFVAAQIVFLGGYLLTSPESELRRSMKDGRVRGVLLAFAITIGGFLHWVPAFLAQRAQVQADFWTAPLSLDHFLSAAQVMFFGSYRGFGTIWSVLLALLIPATVLGLLWKPRKADLYLVVSVAVPIWLSCLVSEFDTKVLTTRYFLFTHLFFLASIAALICRIKTVTTRRVAIALVFVNGLFIWSEHAGERDIADYPGGRAATAFLDEHRQPSEPVITCSPLLHYSLLYYSKNRQGWLIHDNPDYPLAHYRGKPLVRKGELVSNEGLEQLDAEFVWVADMQSGWTVGHVAVPSTWKAVREEQFREFHRIQGVTIMTKYRTSTGPSE